MTTAGLSVTVYDNVPTIRAERGATLQADSGGAVWLTLDDAVGLWEALTDAMREDHGEHLRAYLTPPAVPSAPARGAGVEGPGEAVEASPPARPVDTDFECCASGRCEVCTPGAGWSA